MWVQYWYMYTCLHIDIYKYTYPLIRNRHADQFSTVSFFEFNLNNSNITHCNICMYLASFQAFCFAIGLASGLTNAVILPIPTNSFTWRACTGDVGWEAVAEGRLPSSQCCPVLCPVLWSCCWGRWSSSWIGAWALSSKPSPVFGRKTTVCHTVSSSNGTFGWANSVCSSSSSWVDSLSPKRSSSLWRQAKQLFVGWREPSRDTKGHQACWLWIGQEVPVRMWC